MLNCTTPAAANVNEAFKTALRQCIQAQKVVDGKRATQSCLSVFALPRVGKQAIKNGSNALEEATTKRVQTAQLLEVVEKIRNTKVSEPSAMETIDKQVKFMLQAGNLQSAAGLEVFRQLPLELDCKLSHEFLQEMLAQQAKHLGGAGLSFIGHGRPGFQCAQCVFWKVG